MTRRSYLRLGLLAAIALAATPQAAVAGQTVYVTNPGANQVALFDTDSGGHLVPKTPSSINVGNGPVGVAITPNGRWGYVASINDGTVYQFGVGGDGLLNPLTPPGASAGTGPTIAATTPDGNNLYSVNQFGSDISQYSVGADGLLTPKSPPSVAAGGSSATISVSPDGHSAYVPDAIGNSVLQFDIGTNGALSPKSPPSVGAAGAPLGSAISPDGKSVYAANQTGDTISQYDVGANGALSPKSPPTVATGDTPVLPTVSPDGHSVYVANQGDDTVSQFDVGADGALTAKSPPTAAVGGTSIMVAISPDGKSAYVTSQGSNFISQFDVGNDGTLSPKSPPTVGGVAIPTLIAFTPVQPPVAQATVSTATKAASFDGSASTDQDGSIAGYEWDFGDGQSASGARVDHSYSKPGTYTATLTVSDQIGCSTRTIWQGWWAYCNGSPQASKSVQVEAGSVLSGMHIQPGFFRADSHGKVLSSKRRPRGSELRFRLSSDAGVGFTVQKRIPGRKVTKKCVKPQGKNTGNRRCGRGFYKEVFDFAMNGKAGLNRTSFSARFPGGNLTWGVYRLRAIATKNGASSAPRYSYFKIAHP